MKGSTVRPTRRAFVLAAVALVATAAVAIVALVTMAQAGEPAQRLASSELPALDALNDNTVAVARGQAQVIAAVNAPSADARAAAITAGADAGRTNDSAWARFLAAARPSPAAQELIDQYTAADRRAATAVAALFTSDPAADANFASKAAAEQAAYETESGILGQLQGIYTPQADASAVSVVDRLSRSRFWLLASLAAGLAALAAAAGLLLRDARRDERTQADDRTERALAARRSDLETRLQRGLEMTSVEEGAFAVVNQALRMVGGETAVEVLTADSSHAHFRRATSTDPDEQWACGVAGPQDCPAASSGQSRTFRNSADLDTCPCLRQRGEGRWAMCVPIGMAGRTTGVMHAEGPVASPPPAAMRPEMELVARKAGDRVGALRILARSESQAKLDPLTGLANRRTLERRVREIVNDASPFVVAFLDLDHFKHINDTHGHDTGDRALRLFGRVLRDGVRPRDIIARYGGEEFIVVLPDGSLPQARAVAERIRAQLDLALAAGGVPSFTISAGLAASLPDEPFEEVVARADSMLLRAKLEGRNRIVSFGDDLDAETLHAER
jgi:diguanylate cyclase (GGDEF)-like protein